MNLPNKLTVARLVLVPVFVLLMSVEHAATYAAAYVVFTAASLTDYYDGKIARSRQLITNFGKLMDPLADKVLMCAAFIMLMKVPILWVPGWTIIAILAREFLVTGARSIASSGGPVIAANQWGKIKTVLQMVFVYVFLFLAIAFMIGSPYLSDSVQETLAYALQWACAVSVALVAVFTVVSGVQFIWTNRANLQLGNDI